MFFFAVVISGGFSLLVAFGYENGLMDFAFVKLYHYQLAKIEDQTRPDVVFVGDSSLGNAIDVAKFQRLSGKQAQNLALSAAYGYAGTLNMIRRVAQKQKPTLVVIMHTPDILTRPVAYDGYLYTALSLEDWKDIPLPILARTFANFDAIMSMARNLFRKSGMPDNMAITNDYIRQGPPLNSQGRESYRISAANINPKKLLFLKRIAAFCSGSDLQCVYTIGPWFEGFCEQSGGFISATKNLVSATGLTVTNEDPKCLAPQDLGDAWDHVVPHAKKTVTEFYYRQLQSFLGADPDNT